MNPLTDTKTEKVAEIISELYPETIDRLLVVGCGDGIEAAILATRLNASVTGVDVANSFDERATKFADLRLGDAMNLDLEDETFDFVFSYHALEHIPDPHQALREMHRVLKPDGGFWIGTPNRTRVVGYIGSKEGTLGEKIRWNLTDYKARLSGKFRNEFGAHAGFSPSELQTMLSAVFTTVDNVSHKYFRAVYPGYSGALNVISPFARYLYPSVYFTGRK